MAAITMQPVRRLFLKAGAKRVSDKAALLLAGIIEEKASALVREAEKLSRHAGRKTVLKSDIKLVRKALES